MIANPLDRPQLEEIDYPSSDGQPMAETGIHANTMMLLKQALDDLLISRNADAYVAIDMNWYWEKGNNNAVKAPDVMVILGVGRHERNSFKSWEEGGRVPDVIFEVASRNTWREDVSEKKDKYQRLGVREYFIFDPVTEFIDPSLTGYRLENGYDLEQDEGNGMASQVLQVQLTPEGSMLRLFDWLTKQPVLTRSERAEQEHQRAEQERQRAEQEHQRAEQEHQRAEQEHQRAEQEHQRADTLANEVARLLELLRQTGE